MKKIVNRNWLAASLSAVVLFAAAAGAPLFANWSVAQAQDATPTPAAPEQPLSPMVAGSTMPRTITVVGDGTVNIQPDVARANIGVEVINASVEEAATENSRITKQVQAALAEMGIAQEDIQTSNYSVFAERYSPDGSPSAEVQYRVTNTVNVLIRDLNRVGEVLDTSITAGANNIYGVEFLLDDPTEARSAARQEAVANAQATAEELAALSGVQLGRLISISEVIASTGGMYNNQFSQFATGLGGGGIDSPIQPGQLRLTMQLQVVYELVD